MFENLKAFKIGIVGFFGSLSALLGFRGVLVLVLFLLAAIDFATGWVAALKNGEWKSSKARDGIAHKVGMFVVVVTAGTVDVCLNVICAAVPDIGFKWMGIVLPLVLAWYIVTEIGSILENAALLGAPVPAWLIKMLDVSKRAIDNTADKNIPKESK